MLIQATTKNEISDNLIVRRTKNQFGTKYTKAGKRFLMTNRRRISTFFSASHTRDTREFARFSSGCKWQVFGKLWPEGGLLEFYMSQWRVGSHVFSTYLCVTVVCAYS